MSGILELYEKTSGQSLNKHKTTILFSPAVGADVRDGIVKDCGAQYKITVKKYLGLPIMVVEAKVEELLDDGNSGWNVELVKQVLNKDEVDIVCKLSVSFSSLPDKQIWAFTENGMCSVRSAYHVQVNRKRMESGEFSSKIDEGWEKLWKLNVLGIIKVFVWKAIANCLPIKKNLMKRKVTKEALCPMCKRCDETVCHVLWSCSGASDVWACERSPVQNWSSSENDFFELWYEGILAQLEVMAVVLRRLWLRRNVLVFDNGFEGPNEVFNQAVDCLTEFQ
ncbi:uncharacterized protein LOC121249430 [Juglans microcarpa x Juglans regia]|uniref:uncharacterized protein LOC121249430 n=1 Tax=Juglans microcarpa x Juglans regia TaxID=2249226 RepID=UPI001B7DA1E2|nr:uncharacterized protein LOC121249430 [Juglans microcarpa x Juglans regia]